MIALTYRFPMSHSVQFNLLALILEPSEGAVGAVALGAAVHTLNHISHLELSFSDMNRTDTPRMPFVYSVAGTSPPGGSCSLGS